MRLTNFPAFSGPTPAVPRKVAKVDLPLDQWFSKLIEIAYHLLFF